MTEAVTSKSDDSPEGKMARRYPQPVLVGDVMRYRLCEPDQRPIGDVNRVTRSSAGKIHLVVLLNHRFGWARRLVAVPIEVVGIRGVQVVALDISLDQLRALPTWTADGPDAVLDPGDSIRIALTKS